MENWIKDVDYPNWMSEEGLKTLSKQHLLDGENPKQMYERIVETLGETLYEMYREQAKLTISESKKLTKKAKEFWFNYMWKGWLSPSTPILANCGTDRGYTISCYVMRVPDSLDGIYDKVKEMAMLTKYGGGVGITIDKVRGRGEKISKGGFTEGVVPFIKVNDSAVIATSQGGVRRGSVSMNLPVRHKDVNEYLNIRLPEGDVNRQCLNINHCVTIDDYFMEDVENGNVQARETYTKIINTRMKTGQPYIMYYHNVHNQRPEDMKKRNLKVDGTNICTEILSFHDKDHTVVCDLASGNVAYFDKWKDDTEFVEYGLLFLDVNLQYFIKKAKGKDGFENAIRFAEKSRLLGFGLLGFHTYLQDKMIPFVSHYSRSLLNTIGNKLKTEGNNYNKKYGKLFGTPEWCDENRNLCLFAVAPTFTTATIKNVSNEIEPIVANAFIQKTAKGTFIRKNKHLQQLLETKYPHHNTTELWKVIMEDYKGSVQKLEFLTDEEKEVFLTAYEMNQMEIIRQAAILQKYIDQGISLNLFFPADVSPKWFSQCHIEAWKQGIKTLYYVRTESISSRDMNSNTFSDCVYCEG